MNLDLTDRVVLVAGSSRGIGRAIAEEFLREGARTAITGRDPQSLGRAAHELKDEFGADRVVAFAADMTSDADIQRVVQAVMSGWGRVEKVVANVGTGRGTPGWNTEPADWTRLFEMNLVGAVRLAEAVLPSMVAVREGSIVLVGSIAGLEALPAPLPYGAAKAALTNYGKNLARQVGALGIRVNVVAPGNILFPGGSWAHRRSERAEEVENYVRAEVPLQRFGSVEEVAGVVAFLSSKRASFITGSCVVVDGGQTRGL